VSLAELDLEGLVLVVVVDQGERVAMTELDHEAFAVDCRRVTTAWFVSRMWDAETGTVTESVHPSWKGPACS
jgi:hypothetical protein